MIDQTGFEKVDASLLVAAVLAVKDEAELNSIKKKVKHSKLSEGVEQAVNDSKYVSSSDKDLVEICYPAIIQSGGNFNLKFSAAADKNNLHYGCIVCALGFRYKNYCSNIVRTLMVDPTERMQENYKYLLTLEEELIGLLNEGARLNEIYDKIKAKCQADRPELVEKLTQNFGFVIGIEFREPAFLITNKCTAEVKAGMTFQISIGFSDLTNPEGKSDEAKKYALFIGDTVQVNKDDEAASVLTSAKKKMENIGIFIKEDENEKDDESGNEENKGEGHLKKKIRHLRYFINTSFTLILWYLMAFFLLNLS